MEILILHNNSHHKNDKMKLLSFRPYNICIGNNLQKKEIIINFVKSFNNDITKV